MAELDNHGWISEYLTEDPNDLDTSVWPVCDDIEHNLDTPSLCPCGVIVEELSAGVFIYTHQASDGRE